MAENSPLSSENLIKKADYIYQLIQNRRNSIERRAKNIIDEIKLKCDIKSMDDAKKLAVKIFDYLASFIIFLMFVIIFNFYFI